MSDSYIYIPSANYYKWLEHKTQRLFPQRVCRLGTATNCETCRQNGNTENTGLHTCVKVFIWLQIVISDDEKSPTCGHLY